MYTSVSILTGYVVCRLQRKRQNGKMLYILHLKTVKCLGYYVLLIFIVNNNSISLNCCGLDLGLLTLIAQRFHLLSHKFSVGKVQLFQCNFVVRGSHYQEKRQFLSE